MDVYLRGKRIKLKPSASIGKGGEADVFDIGKGVALKVFKAPDHPDYDGLDDEQQGARERLATHQEKLPAFPRGLPDRVIAPAELATDAGGKTIVGYSMALIAGAEALMRCGEPAVRRGGLGGAEVTRVLCDLHATVDRLHRAGVVIGDFNDLNVLVKEGAAVLIDADSFQFGRFLCRVFTERFVDPLLCDETLNRPALCRPFNEASDWYAFAVMAMQTLLCVGPWGGVLKPRSPSARVPQGARPLRRITVFHPEVQYPKPAIRRDALPDALLDHLQMVFERDRRGVFPMDLLASLEWTTCAGCGLEHARARCPACAKTPTQAIIASTVVRGEVTAERVFATSGTILAAALARGELRWIFHERGAYRREDGSVILSGSLDPALLFAIQADTTLVGRGGMVAALAPGAPPVRFGVDTAAGRPVFAANARHHYFAEAGRLLRQPAAGDESAWTSAGGPEHVGDVLAGQTRFWVGDRMGFGLYRAGGLSVAFVFDAERPGINDSVKLRGLTGQLIDATAVFDERRAWTFFAIERGGRIIHRCAVIDASGAVLAEAEAEAGDGSWLGTLRGKCAIAGFLLAATDTGIVRVEIQPAGGNPGALAETRRFPDTEPFTSSACALFAGAKGLYAVTSKEIRRLRIS